MTRGETVVKNAKCTHGHRSVMSNAAWCDLNARNKLLLPLNNFNLKVVR